jgi:hypothetical protein
MGDAKESSIVLPLTVTLDTETVAASFFTTNELGKAVVELRASL